MPKSCFLNREEKSLRHVAMVPKFLGPVVRRQISTNPRLNFNPGVFLSLSIALSRIISSILFRVFYHKIVDGKN